MVFTHQPGQHEGDVFAVALGGAEEQAGVVWHNLQHQGQEVVRVQLTTFLAELEAQHMHRHDQDDDDRKQDKIDR